MYGGRRMFSSRPDPNTTYQDAVQQFQQGNQSKGIELLRKAAESNHGDALAQLGTCYSMGVQVGQDYAAAFGYFQRAMEAGSDLGESFVAQCYLFGRGVEQNEQKAFELLSYSVEKQHLPSYVYLAGCYFDGKGTQRNPTKAIEIYLQGATMECENCLATLTAILQYKPLSDSEQQLIFSNA